MSIELYFTFGSLYGATRLLYWFPKMRNDYITNPNRNYYISDIVRTGIYSTSLSFLISPIVLISDLNLIEQKYVNGKYDKYRNPMCMQEYEWKSKD